MTHATCGEKVRAGWSTTAGGGPGRSAAARSASSLLWGTRCVRLSTSGWGVSSAAPRDHPALGVVRRGPRWWRTVQALAEDGPSTDRCSLGTVALDPSAWAFCDLLQLSVALGMLVECCLPALLDAASFYCLLSVVPSTLLFRLRLFVSLPLLPQFGWVGECAGVMQQRARALPSWCHISVCSLIAYPLWSCGACLRGSSCSEMASGLDSPFAWSEASISEPPGQRQGEAA